MRHICGISGGKDSSALAVYLKDEIPDMEYFFCDTGAELPETYEYLSRLEIILGKPIARLNSERGFDYWFKVFAALSFTSNALVHQGDEDKTYRTMDRR